VGSAAADSAEADSAVVDSADSAVAGGAKLDQPPVMKRDEI
jgi:hypothetical protein